MDTTYLTDLTDAQWAVIEPYLPPAKSNLIRGGRPGVVDLRTIVNGILYIDLAP